MTTQRRLTSILEVVAFLSLLVVCVTEHANAVSCGPGTDWVDTCVAGTDSFASRADHAVIILVAAGVILLSDVTGTTTVFRGNPIGPEPLHIDTEMVSFGPQWRWRNASCGRRRGRLTQNGKISNNACPTIF